MSDYQFTLSIELPGGIDARPLLDAITEMSDEYVNRSEFLDEFSSGGAPAWDVTHTHPSTAYLEAGGRWELEADLETFSAVIETEWPGAVLRLSDEWRGDGEPTSSTTAWVNGIVVSPTRRVTVAASLLLPSDVVVSVDPSGSGGNVILVTVDRGSDVTVQAGEAAA